MPDADAFGYPCLSLDETITQLSKLREENPELGQHPLWVMNLPPLYWPIRLIRREVTREGSLKGNYQISVYVETGAH